MTLKWTDGRESDETVVTRFLNTSGDWQIVTDGPDAKCPTCGYPERHRIFDVKVDTATLIADGCPSCETSRMVTLCRDCVEGKHGACIGSAFVETGDEIAEVACGCSEAVHAPATYRWTCEACGEGGTMPEGDLIDNVATRHASSHAKGPFDVLPRILIGEATS